MQISDWIVVIFGSSGVIGFVGLFLKNNETNRTATFEEMKELDDRLKSEIKRLDDRLDEEISRRITAEKLAQELEEENKRLVEENNWHQERIRELEGRVDKLERELEKERINK
jgi:FtsZ-binding cell division protein ZapB